MKKFKVLLLTLTLAVAMFGCAKTPDANQESQVQPTEAPAEPTAEPVVTEAPTAEPVATEAPVADEDAKSEGVMTYDEYVAAALDSEVVIEAYVQAKQSWWEDNGQGKVTVYAQDKDGAYFLYEMACTAEENEKLVPGTKIKVTGYKAEWSGEVEIIDATFEIMEGNFVADPLDVTGLLGTEELDKHQNEKVAFKGMTVEASKDAEGNDVAFLYNWDGSGQDGNDLYFNVSYNGVTYNFTVESYLCDNTTDVYAAVKNVQIGDVIDMEGFLYWYNGANPHITSVTVCEEVVEEDVKSEGVMTYAEYAAAAMDSEVVIEAYVQAKQSWWEDNGQGKVTVYAQDKDGAYFLYEMACTAEENEKLVEGTKIKVTGYKAEWSGEVEIIDATFEIMEGNFVAEALDVTELLGADELINHQNKKVAFKGMTVEASKDAEGNDVAFLYNWDGSGQDGNDLYFNVSYNGATYTFTVESYLCDNTTDVYAAVKNLQIGDVIDMEGFLYWYNGVNPHITSVTVK